MRLRVKLKNNGQADGVTSDSDSDHESERGRTVLAAVRKAIQNGVKIPLEWNAAKVPCGEHRTTFGTYLGVVARERVNINYEKWKNLPAELMNELYNDITKGFTVLPDRRRWIISRASERWRSFKARLVKKYLYKSPGKIRKKAPSKYPFIFQDDWEKFTAYCTSDKFKETSEKNRARGKMNTSKYRGGRQGYQHFDEVIAKEFQAQGIHIEKVPRHLIWLKAHENKADESYAPADLEIAEAIKTLDAQAQKGEITAEGRDDILAKVMKKPEHGGRVRAVGSGITNKEYFGSANRPKASQMLEEIGSLRSEVAQLAAMQNAMMTFFMAWSQQENSPFTPEQMKQFMAQGFGLGFSQSTSVEGQSGGSGGQWGGFGQFSQSGGVGQLTGTRQCGTGHQNVDVPNSRGSSETEVLCHTALEADGIPEPETDRAQTDHDFEPESDHDFEPESDHDFEPETDHDADLETDDAKPEEGHISELETDGNLQPGTGPNPEPETDPETETDPDPEPETNHIPQPETCHMSCDRTLPKHFVGAPPTYSTANIDEVRSLWIRYVFQH